MASFLLLCLVVTLIACDRQRLHAELDTPILETGRYSATNSVALADPRIIITDFPTSLRIYHGNIINEVAFVYGSDEVAIGNSSGNREEFELKRNEYITEVSGNSVNVATADGTTAVSFTELCFITNLQDTFRIQANWNDAAYGVKETFQYKARDGNAVFCLYGTNKPSITSIGFYEKKLPDIDVENINTTPWLIASAIVLLLALVILLTVLILKKKRYRF